MSKAEIIAELKTVIAEYRAFEQMFVQTLIAVRSQIDLARAMTAKLTAVLERVENHLDADDPADFWKSTPQA